MTESTRQHGGPDPSSSSALVLIDSTALATVAGSTGSRDQKLFGLQMLRGLAAVSVVYSHLMDRVILRGFVSSSAWWLNLGIGRFGVCVFFAISGFVMVHANRNRFGQPDFRKNVAVYFRHRMARIYPPYFLATIVAIFFIYLSKHEPINVVNILKSLTFVPYLNPHGFYEPVYGVGWTLNYEVFFYLTLGVTLSFPMRRAVIAICLFIIALVMTGVIVGGNPDNYFHSAVLWSYTRAIMAYFMSGVLARAIPLHPFELRIARMPLFPILLALLAAYISYRNVAEELTVAPLFIFLFIRFTVSYISYDMLWHGVLQLFEFLGDSSYSVYLTHSFIQGILTIAVARLIHNPVIGVIACLCIGITASFALGGVVYIFVERPMVQKTSRWLASLGNGRRSA